MNIGILGGGQLAMMLGESSPEHEYSIFDPNPDSPGFRVGKKFNFNYDNFDALKSFAESVDIITFEFENIPSDVLNFLSNQRPINPNPKVLEISCDRLTEKEFFQSLQINIAPFVNIEDDYPEFQGTKILKTRTLGYDGKGQAKVSNRQELMKAHKDLNVPCVLEDMIKFDYEVSQIASRDHKGNIAFYPLTRNEHKNGILRKSYPIEDSTLSAPSRDIARKVMESLKYIGTLAIEFFVIGEKLIVNEMAPRVHNSGHWTMDGTDCSQFRNHILAITGNDIEIVNDFNFVTMINLIGEINKEEFPKGEFKLYDYYKEPRAGRKLGHINLLS